MGEEMKRERDEIQEWLKEQEREARYEQAFKRLDSDVRREAIWAGCRPLRRKGERE